MGDVSKESIEHPDHYTQGGIECIEAIEAMCGDGYEDYLRGNILKYLWRYPHKNGIEDLYKAKQYLDWLVEFVEKLERESNEKSGSHNEQIIGLLNADPQKLRLARRIQLDKPHKKEIHGEDEREQWQ